MKIFILIYLIITLFSFESYSQQNSLPKSKVKITIDWGKKFENSKVEDIEDIFYNDGKNIYATISSKDKNSTSISLAMFDSKMLLLSRKKIGVDEDMTGFYDTFFLEGKFVLIFSKINSKTKTRDIYGQKYTTDFEKEGEKIFLWSIAEECGRDIFEINKSPDSKNLLLSFFPDQLKVKQGKEYRFKVFDSDLKTIFEKNETLDIPTIQVDYKSCLINNKEDVFVFTKVFKKLSRSNTVSSDNGKIPGFTYVITKYSKDGKKENFDIDLKNKFIQGLYTKSESNGDLSLFITYENSFNDGIDGTVFLKFDAASEKLNTINEYMITKELSDRIGDFQGDKPNKKTNSINDYFVPTDLHTVEDGSTYAILEKNYEVLSSTSNDIYSEGMIVLKINPDGSLNWSRYIPKLQNMFIYIKAWVSHLAIYLNNDLLIYYNDKGENDKYDIINELKATKIMTTIKDISFVQIEFDNDGKISRNIISNREKMGTAVNIYKSKQLTSHQILLCGFTTNGSGGSYKTQYGVGTIE